MNPFGTEFCKFSHKGSFFQIMQICRWNVQWLATSDRDISKICIYIMIRTALRNVSDDAYAMSHLSAVNLACTHGLAWCWPTRSMLSLQGVAWVYQLAAATYSSNIYNGRALDGRATQASGEAASDYKSRKLTTSWPPTGCWLSILTVGINSKSCPWPADCAHGLHFQIRHQTFTYF